MFRFGEDTEDWLADAIEDEKDTLLKEVKMKLHAFGKFDKGWTHVWDLAAEAREETDEFLDMCELLQLSKLHIAALTDADEVIMNQVLSAAQYRRELAYD